jgi:processive 1,2-diacylglycerol beta-glucosyltransferase
MLIHHLVPGQEEGNLRLLEAIGAGSLADTPASISSATRDLLADQAAAWRKMKQALARHGRNSGALHAAKFILSSYQSEIRNPQSPISSQ